MKEWSYKKNDRTLSKIKEKKKEKKVSWYWLNDCLMDCVKAHEKREWESWVG
jgi:hypothetical protein